MTEDVKELQEEVQELRNLVTILFERVNILTQENTDLKRSLLKYEHKKKTVTIVPFHLQKIRIAQSEKACVRKVDINRRGQKGRKGNTLKIVKKPNFTQKHIPLYCNCCGESLENTEAEFVGKQQVFDIPKIEINVNEHQVYIKQCKSVVELVFGMISFRYLYSINKF